MYRRATGKRTLAEAGDARQQPPNALQQRQRRRKLGKLHAAGVAEALPGVGLHIPARRIVQRSVTAGNVAARHTSMRRGTLHIMRVLHLCVTRTRPFSMLKLTSNA